MRETIEWRESFSEFHNQDLMQLMKTYLNFECFAENLKQKNIDDQIIWFIFKELYLMLKPNHLHSKLNKVNDILCELYEKYSCANNTLHKGRFKKVL